VSGPGRPAPHRSLVPAVAVLAGAGLLAVLAPVLIPPGAVDVVGVHGPSLAPPSLRYPLGTDEFGLSVLTLTLAGARLSVGVGFIAATLAVAVGALVGLTAGVLRGPAAAALTWIMDWFLMLPQVPLAIAFVAVLSPGLRALVLVIALTSWAPVARVIRTAVLAAKAQPYLDRVRALGAGNWHITRVHLLPDVMPVIAVNWALTLANAILAEAAFSYLGLGAPAEISWGSMLRQASTSGALSAGAWWYVLPPGLAVIIVVLAAGGCANAISSAQTQQY
jgi:peptide/nickel transport system permease protein